MELTEITNQIIKYLEGKLPKDEQLQLVQWVKESESNARLYAETKDAWEANYIDASKFANTKNEWTKFQFQIKNVSADLNLRLKKRLRIWQSAAAILVLMLLGYGAFLSFNPIEEEGEALMVQTIVPSGEKSQVVLPDGTKIWVNSASVLSYATDFGKNKREVKIDGEAFFEVAHNPDMPFRVFTKDCEVKVLGTKFNVRSYSSGDQTETALLEGKVEVTLLSGKQVGLSPGELAMANNDRNELKVIQKSVRNSICWKDNVLRFDNTPLSEVIEKLGHWYGINLHLSNINNLEEKRFTFTVKTESLSELLSIIKLVQPMKYQIKGEDVYIEIINK
jgi:ferric-dicitrate binding protein FerR (iron transport regulator)